MSRLGRVWMVWLLFWWRCLCYALRPSFDVADRIVAFGTAAIAAMLSIFGYTIDFNVAWYWLILSALGLVFMIRLLFIAPYRLYKKAINSAKERLARDNPGITYNITVNEGDRTEINVHYNYEELKEYSADYIEKKHITFVRFTSVFEVIDAANVSGVADNGFGDFTINFTKPLNPETLVVHAMPPTPTTFRVEHVTEHSVRIVFDGEPYEIALRFDD